jgi:Leucine-rich repeat (LRR) protein
MKRKPKTSKRKCIKKVKMSASIECLPDSIILEIFSFFSQTKLCSLAVVCKKWKRLALDGSLWRKVDLQRLKSHEIDNLMGTPLGRQLRRLVVWKCSLSPENLVTLSESCPQLQELCLRRNTIKEQKVKRLRKPYFPQLLVLDARELQGYVGHAIQTVAYAQNIERVAIDSSMDGFFDPRVFNNATRLQILDCSRCMDVQDECVASIAFSCPNLQSLSLMRCYNFEGTSLPNLFRYCSSLRSLSISYTHVTNRAIEGCDLENSCLQELDMSHCPGISSSGVYSVTSRLKDMVYLNVNSCSYGPGINQLVVRTLTRFSSLEVLDLDPTDGVNGADEDLISITQRCSSTLQVLRINKGFATLTGLKQCLQNLPNLKRFGIVNYRQDYLDGGMEVQQVLNSLAKFNPKLEILELSDFRDKETRKKTNAFIRLMVRCRYLRKISIFTFNRDMFVMAAEGRIKSKREDIRLVQPTMICPTPRVVTTLPRLCFDRSVYGDEVLYDDDPWRARKYY